MGWSLSAFADVTRWELSLNPGYANPLGSTADLVKGSFALQASGIYEFHDWFSGGLEVGYSFGHKVEGITPDGFSFTSNVTFKILQVTPVLRIGKLVQLGTVLFRPYGILGVGFYNVRNNSGRISFPIGDVDSDSSNDFGVNGGGGMSFYLGRNLGLGFDLRYHHLVETGDDEKFVTPSARFTLLF